MDIGQIIGPIIAIAISIVFTVWHTRKLHREDRIEEYKERYLDEVDQWADSVLKVSERMSRYVPPQDRHKLSSNKESLEHEGERLAWVSPAGAVLSKQISEALDALLSFPKDMKLGYDQNEVEKLDERCNVIKCTVSELRYKS